MEDGTCPYTLLGLSSQATSKEVKKAYRKMALKFHPDKNPGNEAVFHKIVEAYNMLSDEAARKAYDKVLKAKEAARMRNEKRSAAQQKDKHDLEAREAAAASKRATLARNLQAEIIRIREANQRLIEEEQTRLRKELHKAPAAAAADEAHVVEVRWSTKGLAEDNGGYTRERLYQLFRKYNCLDVVMGKKPGKAIVAFDRRSDAEGACNYERGLQHNPFAKLSLVLNEGDRSASAPSQPGRMDVDADGDSNLQDLEAYERIVLEKLRQAQRAKR